MIPFYKALEYLMNTANGRIKRHDWEDRYFLNKTIIDGKPYIRLMKVGCYTKELIDTGLYIVNQCDIIAEDWEIIPMESYE